jgi:hypothetical protein
MFSPNFAGSGCSTISGTIYPAATAAATTAVISEM